MCIRDSPFVEEPFSGAEVAGESSGNGFLCSELVAGFPLPEDGEDGGEGFGESCWPSATPLKPKNNATQNQLRIA